MAAQAHLTTPEECKSKQTVHSNIASNNGKHQGRHVAETTDHMCSTCAQVQLVAKMKPRRELPGREICHQGDSASRVWLLTEGQVVVVLHGEEGHIERDPAVLGETALLQDDVLRFRNYPVGFRCGSCARLECMRECKWGLIWYVLGPHALLWWFSL